jgi:hypothetical protein
MNSGALTASSPVQPAGRQADRWIQAQVEARTVMSGFLPLARDSAACSAWSRHTITVKNDGSCSLRPETATRNMARAIPPSV